MTKDIYINKNGPFSISGGILVIGDINAYRLVINMGTETSHMTAMAVCKENGEFSSNFECIGSRIFLTLENSMYKKEGYITIRLAISGDDCVLTAKEIVFRVVASNNADTIAKTHSGTIENILTAVQKAAKSAESAISAVDSKADADKVYTKDETSVKIIQNSSLLSNALTGKAIGEGIRMDDISPIQHDMKIFVTGDNPQTTSVMQYNKNIYDAGKYTCAIDNGTLLERLSNGVICQGNKGDSPIPAAWSNGWARFSGQNTRLSAGVSYTISADYTVLETGEGRTGKEPVSIQFRAADNESPVIKGESFSKMPEVGKTVRMHMTYVSLANGIYYPQFSLNSNKVRIENIQVEIGEKASPFEPYQPPITFAPNTDGLVEGVKSVSPTMTFITDTPGAIINCEYNRDANKVIEQLTNAIISLGGNV